MGEIVGAGIVSHVPTIMLPEEVRLEINEGRRSPSFPGCSGSGPRCSTASRPTRSC